MSFGESAGLRQVSVAVGTRTPGGGGQPSEGSWTLVDPSVRPDACGAAVL